MSDTKVLLNYESRFLRNSRWATGIFIASIVTALVFFLVIPSLVIFLAAIVVNVWMNRQDRVGGHGFSRIAITISGTATLAGVITLVLMPSVGCTRCGGHRSVCAANLRGITQSMNIYAADNSDAYPLVMFDPSVPNRPSAASTGTTDADKAIQTYFGPGKVQAGNVQAAMWLLVLNGQVAAKQFICTEDNFTDRTKCNITDGAGNYFDNFQSPEQLSYSMAYPWTAAGKPGDWWTCRTDAGLPLMADMTPQQGTGKPARNLTPASAPRDNKTWNSGNHGGEGQNVGFGDGHAEFVRTPIIDKDNIYSMSASPSKGPAEFGGIPAGAAPPMLMSDKRLFDIIMLPVRDETTGKM